MGDGRFAPRVRYQYNLAGQVFQGSGIGIPSEGSLDDAPDETFDTREAADSVVARYPVGGEVAVGYDPGDPTRSVLRPVLRWWSLALAIGGLFVLTLGIIAPRILPGRDRLP
jgi:Protein of unknown function (DUF3592)